MFCVGLYCGVGGWLVVVGLLMMVWVVGLFCNNCVNYISHPTPVQEWFRVFSGGCYKLLYFCNVPRFYGGS